MPFSVGKYNFGYKLYPHRDIEAELEYMKQKAFMDIGVNVLGELKLDTSYSIKLSHYSSIGYKDDATRYQYRVEVEEMKLVLMKPTAPVKRNFIERLKYLFLNK